MRFEFNSKRIFFIKSGITFILIYEWAFQVWN
jgi:hypothetical protein